MPQLTIVPCQNLPNRTKANPVPTQVPYQNTPCQTMPNLDQPQLFPPGANFRPERPFGTNGCGSFTNRDLCWLPAPNRSLSNTTPQPSQIKNACQTWALSTSTININLSVHSKLPQTRQPQPGNFMTTPDRQQTQSRTYHTQAFHDHLQDPQTFQHP